MKITAAELNVLPEHWKSNHNKQFCFGPQILAGQYDADNDNVRNQ